MAIKPIGVSGLNTLEKAQLLGSIHKSQVSNLVGGLASAVSPALDGDLLNQIYDQKAITPQIRAAVAAKTAASESGSSESVAEKLQTSINDSLIEANRAASSSEVPKTRPDPVVKVDVVA